MDVDTQAYRGDPESGAQEHVNCVFTSSVTRGITRGGIG